MFGATSPARSFLRLAAAAVALGVLFAPSPARADEPVAPEVDTNPTTHPPSSARANLLIGGAVATVAWYGVAFGSSYLWSDADHASALRIPFAGPFVGLANTGCGASEAPCETLTVVFRTAVYVLSAVGQVGGAAAMLEGAFLETTAPGQERTLRPRRADVVAPAALSVSVAPAPPVTGSRDTGLSGLSVQVLGRF